MKLQFIGSVRSVTGSSYLVITDTAKILVDCGMFQGHDGEKRNFLPFPFNPSELDAVLLTHSHIDHSGLIPKLVKEGFKGKIITTKATADLCGIMLLDSAHADRQGLLDCLTHFKTRPKRVFVVHGEEEISLEFAKTAHEKFLVDSYVPRVLEEVKL
ncbi:MAG: MBL fold metallo-hydrolase [Deltaproteobacteria bacterium]|nr:MBL fold metallo-hydrolase [Deltaproteobacteria bacterium]